MRTTILDEQDSHPPPLHGHGGRLHVHCRLQPLHRHDRRGGVDSIYAENFFTDVGCGSNHTGHSFDHTINVSDHTDNASPLLCYNGRQIDDTDLLRLSTKLFGLLALTTTHNNNRHEERCYDNRDHRQDSKSKSSRARQFCHHRPDFRPKISTLLIFYLFWRNIFYYPSKQLFGFLTSFFSYTSFPEPVLSSTPPYTCMRSALCVPGGRQ